MKTSAVVLSLGCMIGSQGCFYTQSGDKFDEKKVAELAPGVSTKHDAIAKLGEPSSITAMPENGELLQWQYVYGSILGGGGALVAILFDSNGKMVRVQHRWHQK